MNTLRPSSVFLCVEGPGRWRADLLTDGGEIAESCEQRCRFASLLRREERKSMLMELLESPSSCAWTSVTVRTNAFVAVHYETGSRSPATHTAP